MFCDVWCNIDFIGFCSTVAHVCVRHLRHPEILKKRLASVPLLPSKLKTQTVLLVDVDHKILNGHGRYDRSLRSVVRQPGPYNMGWSVEVGPSWTEVCPWIFGAAEEWPCHFPQRSVQKALLSTAFLRLWVAGEYWAWAECLGIQHNQHMSRKQNQ